MNNQECNETSISKILNFIIKLQNNTDRETGKGCDRLFLGLNNNLNFNTRPINLYTCCEGTLWAMPYTINGEEGTSSVFKAIKTDGNCATFETLAPNPDTTNPLIPYIGTNNFWTIDLDCVLAIHCLADTYTN